MTSDTYTMVMIMQTAKARFIDRYLGIRDEMSFPAGRTFSNVHLVSVCPDRWTLAIHTRREPSR